jgi:GNAT superfamily N-acetyltransferase
MSEWIRDDAPFTEDDMEMHVMDGAPPDGFDCGADDQNDFLYQRARRDQKRGVSVTHLLFIKGILAGYITLMSDRIALGPTEKPKGVAYHLVPAIKIAQLAAAKPFAGYGVGKFLIGFAVSYATAIRGMVGIRYITLDAETDVIGWYAKQGFIRNLEEQHYREQLAEERGRPIDHLAVSMRYDLREPDC